MDAATYFKCDHHECLLSKTACLKRQAAHPRERFWGFRQSQSPPDLSYCQDGQCPQGQLILLELGPLEAPKQNLKIGPVDPILAMTGYRRWNNVPAWKRELIKKDETK